MNNNQFEVNQNIYPSLDLQANSISSPSLSNPTTQSSDYLEENDNQMITNLLLQFIDQKNPKDFRAKLSSNYNILSRNSIHIIFTNILNLYISDKIYASRFLSILIPFGINPNITLKEINYKVEGKDKNEEYNPNESILMLFCSKSNSTIVSYLCESKIKLEVNYLDKKNRNALFYLKGGSEDKKIIELLVEKGINVNQRDIDGNTVLHNALNIGKRQLIYDLIDVGNANFMIKNNKNLNSLEIINQKWISKKNCNYNKYNIIDYKEIKEIIELIKRKLSIILCGQQIFLNKNENNSDASLIEFNNLIKLSSKTNKSKDELNQINNEEKNENKISLDNNNIFLKLNKNPSLIIDTQFNDGLNKTLPKKIDYYKQLNKNKKFFINLLKNSDNFLLENSKILKNEIESKTNELNKLKLFLNQQKKNLDADSENHKNELIKKNAEIAEIQKKEQMIKNKMIGIEPNMNIKQKPKYLLKYESMIKRNNINEDYIYNQLQRDLIDYMQYVHNKNAKLKNTILRIKELLKESVLNCLGKNYEVKIYGSRETGLCLPWSDIDAVISFPENDYIQPLNTLYLYLKKNYTFVDLKYIENTQIPLIKMITTNEFYNMSLDISLELPEHHGAECVCYIKEKIKEYEVLSPMTLALKTLFQKAKINDPYTGGLSSYGIILLIINFLKMKQKEGEDISMKNLGKLFYELLLFYKKKDNINDPIDVNGNDRKQIENIHMTNNNNNELIIIDPLNIYNNVAKNMRQYINIRFALSIAILTIKESCECGCHYQYEGLYIKEEVCEHNLLNNIFNSVKRN